MKSLQILACLAGLHQVSTAYEAKAPSGADQPQLSARQLDPASAISDLSSDENSPVAPWQSEPYQPHYPFNQQCNVSSPSAQSDFWLPNVPHDGTSPFLLNAPNYSIYRNVRDFGAVGDGVHDDTDAFNAAITYGSRCAGGQCPGGTTGKPALVYVPPGTYAIYSTIQLFVNTQIIGDGIDMPTLKAAPSALNGTVVVDGFDKGTQSTTNFYIGLRNVNIDTTAADHAKTIFALNWAVSQATNLINVNFIMPPGSNHIGIEMNGGTGGGGSGLFMGDLTFSGGLIGLQYNNQQYSMRNLTFTNVATAIAITHGFMITMQQINCINVGVCVDVGAQGVFGSLNLIDSSCDNCGVVVNGSTSVVLENIDVKRSGPLLGVNGTTTAQGSLVGQTYISGRVYRNGTGQTIASNATKQAYADRGSLADDSGRYFTKSQPQYTQHPASDFASVKDAGAKGDGKTDDTAAINAALKSNANSKITYFPHGVYVVTDTIYVPPGSRIVGEVWSVISAAGDKFSDEANPWPMIQVGKPGEVGLAEFSDMLFTVSDVLPGAILVEVNMKGTNQGDVSFHNTHARIGGAADSRTRAECQSLTEPCKAAFLVMHLKETSSAYIENSWLWTADHDLDGTNPTSIGTGRGVLVEATAATWLVGTGSEHHTLYGYTLHNAQNVMASLMQVETPYWQPLPQAPYPWTPNATWHDPTFEGCSGNISQCYMSWSVRVLGSDTHAISLYGMGFWVFFNGPNYAPCTGPDGICQVNIIDLEDLKPESAVRLYSVNTKSVQNMISVDGSADTTAVQQAANPGGWGGVVAAFLRFDSMRLRPGVKRRHVHHPKAHPQ
ncbi:hypothetical protein ACET3X_006402 [Alternaria dauci]|uniref:Rhamnogalacturonase A/B/Epimerase-like pectate lyase domain-containing protein n=1 Tax=Alternaria dauci TaxID=48095 RepID=A0ABR3UG87_9PLEO